MEKNKKVMIIAGEASGDLHGANLVKELQQQYPNLQLTGMGGKCMAQAGVKLVVNIADFSVCGFVEVIRYLPKFYTLFKLIKQAVINTRPDLLILIDFPTFNLRLAEAAKKKNIKILYYISPQIWAWHTSRVKKIKKSVSMMGVIFPFELDFYQKYSVPVKYVGHPLINVVPNLNHISSNQKITIGLLPGSRKNEIKYLLPTLIQTAEILRDIYPDINFILPLANTIQEEDIKTYFVDSKINLQIIKENRYEAMKQCIAVIAASGTVTLELTLLNIPMVIVYKANALSYWLAKRLVKIPYVGLCNILAHKKIVVELLQKEANPPRICSEILRLIKDKGYREEQKKELVLAASKLTTQKDCSVGQLVVEMLA